MNEHFLYWGNMEIVIFNSNIISTWFKGQRDKYKYRYINTCKTSRKYCFLSILNNVILRNIHCHLCTVFKKKRDSGDISFPASSLSKKNKLRCITSSIFFNTADQHILMGHKNPIMSLITILTNIKRNNQRRLKKKQDMILILSLATNQP